MQRGDLVRIGNIVAEVERVGHVNIVVKVGPDSAPSLKLRPALLTFPRERLEEI